MLSKNSQPNKGTSTKEKVYSYFMKNSQSVFTMADVCHTLSFCGAKRVIQSVQILCSEGKLNEYIDSNGTKKYCLPGNEIDINKKISVYDKMLEIFEKFPEDKFNIAKLRGYFPSLPKHKINSVLEKMVAENQIVPINGQLGSVFYQKK